MWDNAWHMVAGTFDGTAVRLYLDGLLVGSAPASGAIGYGLTSNAFVIGNATPSGCSQNTSFSGDLDEVMVFDRALSAAQVAALPAVPTPPPEPTPVRALQTPTPELPKPVADGDGDGIPDAEDTLPPGNLPPIAGERVRSVAASGELLVKLPDASGFVPLKGAASLPVGAVVDARKGELTLTAASDARGARGIGPPARRDLPDPPGASARPRDGLDRSRARHTGRARAAPARAGRRRMVSSASSR